MKTLKYISFVFIVLSVRLTAQDLQLTQFYASPLYLNPAFTGANSDSRLTTIYRDQWASLPGTFSSFLLSFDYYFHNYNSGLGLIITTDKAGTQGISNNMIGLTYAFDYKLTRKWTFSMGLRAAYAYRSLDYSKLLFGDQIARNASSSLQTQFPETVDFLDFATGAMVYSSKQWAGISFNHLNSPNESFLGNEVALPVKGSLHGGMNYQLESFGGSGSKEDKPIIVGAFQYRFQKKFDQFDLGIYFKKPQYYAGVWYRGLPGLKAYKKAYPNHDSVSFLLGLIYKKSLTIGYSYDFTVSYLSTATGGSHEISLNYVVPYSKKSKKQRSKIVPCPMFL